MGLGIVPRDVRPASRCSDGRHPLHTGPPLQAQELAIVLSLFRASDPAAYGWLDLVVTWCRSPQLGRV
jgi:hypothetical protein